MFLKYQGFEAQMFLKCSTFCQCLRRNRKQVGWMIGNFLGKKNRKKNELGGPITPELWYITWERKCFWAENCPLHHPSTVAISTRDNFLVHSFVKVKFVRNLERGFCLWSYFNITSVLSFLFRRSRFIYDADSFVPYAKKPRL